MKSFVQSKSRAVSPQNGRVSPQIGQPPRPSDRQTLGANAKAMMRQGQAAPDPRTNSGLPSRGVSNAQNMSATLHRAAPRQHSGHGRVQIQNAWDTDEESLDTTINQSVLPVEEHQNRPYQHHQQRQGRHINAEFHEGEEATEDEAADEEHEEYGIADEDLTAEQMQVASMTHQQMQASQDPFVQRAYSQVHGSLPIVEGDSYPTTTDGVPTEMDAGEDHSEDHESNGRMPPSPRRHPSEARPLRSHALPQQFSHNQALLSRPSLPDEQTPAIFKQGANVRHQQRTMTQMEPQQSNTIPHNSASHPSSQLPSYSQATHENAPTSRLQSNVCTQAQFHHIPNSQRPQRQSPGNVRNPASRQPASSNPRQHPTPASGSASGPAYTGGQVAVQQLPRDPTPLIEPTQNQSIDYDENTLFGMEYHQLKNESYDANPCAGAPVITNDILVKSLSERLQFVHSNLDPPKQAEFFRSLPTAEWEEAGDWFLEQFQDILQRSRQARQKKRKLAQGFEAEVEKRHNHVAKKQRQVEQALSKMKQQGEGLMPRSPRASKSPRPRRDRT